MDFKKLIRALLQSKFGGAQLSDARVNELIEKVKDKVTTEEELEAKLDAFNEGYAFTEIAKDDDRYRTKLAELERLKSTGKGDEKSDKTETAATTTEDMPAWAKALIEGNRTVTEKLAALEGNKVVNDRRSAILGKLTGADETYSGKVLRDFGRMNFADDAAFAEYLGEVESDYTTHTQNVAESKLGNDAPFRGVGKDGKVTEATKDELDSVMNEIGL
ncbi:hypothetical protein [Sphingobacterium corticibacter]|uniref:Uncharacterized protein n=1 Tax=Sphingobacterium corticibacter TaxID=2171749 RepID=A0A2T8HNL5_9SPHI|nr:hypothetical protein [Sphingobacterium corticibacter]PVH27000.1 hypothetical protein DC487_05235 [Sphingobacterium corticibacter]